MEATKILQADMLDILFEGRNKLYGAYDLRKTYNTRIRNALIVTGAVTLVFVTAVLFAGTHKNNSATILVGPDITISNFVDKPKEVPVVKPPEAKAPAQKSLKVTIPKIVPNDQVDKTEVPPNDLAENTKISDVTNTTGTDEIVAPLEKPTSGEVKLPAKEEANDKFIPVQFEARFPGGLDAWKNYLERNLNTGIPVDNGAPAGQYTVFVSFTVDENGNVSDIKADNDPGYGTAAEAVRVIKKSKQWTPALQNGKNVVYRQKQSITFVVTES